MHALVYKTTTLLSKIPGENTGTIVEEINATSVVGWSVITKIVWVQVTMGSRT